jgi:hypothetical protein
MLGRWYRIAGVSLLLATAASPQELAPEVLLLSRIKRHLREELAHVPNYTCLETISRFRDDPRSHLQLHKGLTKLDTVRLEIVYSDGKEWYGSPGAKNLSVENPVAFVGGGMIGNGAFAMTLHTTLEGGIFTYRGEETLDGRPTVRYDFRVPRLLKPLQISMTGGVGTVGEEGSIWVDPQSLDLIRVESRAAEIPPSLPLQESTTNVDFAHMRIGGSDALLAQQADLNMLDDNGVESYNRIDFTHCRSYAATSAISFDSKPEGTGEAPGLFPLGANAPGPGAGPAVPAFLEVTVLLTTPVSDKDSIGTLIEGKISGDVLYKGKVAVPDGSVVHGRIRRLEHYQDRGVYAVGLEFAEVEVHGELLPFYADLLRVDKDPRIQPELSERMYVIVRSSPRLANQTITMPELPGVASFFIKDEHFTLPAGFRIVWRTRGLLR